MFRSIATEQTGTEAWSPELVAELERQRREQLPQDELLQRRLWRDQRLMALMRHKRELPE
jgi:hypothetical protein